MPYRLPMIAKALLAALVILCGPGMSSARADVPAVPIAVFMVGAMLSYFFEW